MPGPRLARWRAQLDGAIQRAAAAALMSSRLGPPGRPTRRRRREPHPAEIERTCPLWGAEPPGERREAAAPPAQQPAARDCAILE